MNVLIVAATELEINPFMKANKKADILITGIGVPATVFHLTKKLIEKKYDLVIQAGIGGTFTDSLNLGEVVLIKKDTFADLGIYEKGNFKTLFEENFIKKNDFPYQDGWLVNHTIGLDKNTLPWVNAVTVNTITDNPIQIKNIQQQFSAQVESMEGAAFHYVCIEQKTIFLQMRSISNIVGERDKTKWKIENSIENLNIELFKFIKSL
jgi:futalosine hydrolase